MVWWLLKGQFSQTYSLSLSLPCCGVSPVSLGFICPGLEISVSENSASTPVQWRLRQISPQIPLEGRGFFFYKTLLWTDPLNQNMALCTFSPQTASAWLCPLQGCTLYHLHLLLIFNSSMFLQSYKLHTLFLTCLWRNTEHTVEISTQDSLLFFLTSVTSLL